MLWAVAARANSCRAAVSGLIPKFRTAVFDVLRGFGAVLVEQCCDLGGGLVAETGMQPDPIIEDLNVFGNRCSGFRPGWEHGAVNQLVLQRGEKRFGHGVVPALPH